MCDTQTVLRPTREDLVDKYLGWSDKKTLKYLRDRSDSTIVFDISKLCGDFRDSFMSEALLAIVKYHDSGLPGPKIIVENIPYSYFDNDALLYLLKKTFC